MAFTQAPNGLQAVGSITSADYNSGLQTFYIESSYATTLGSNDPVSLNATGTLSVGVAGSTSVGVLNQVKYIDEDGVPQIKTYWKGGTVTKPMTGTHGANVAIASVISDPNVTYAIQTDDVTGIELTDLNQNANFDMGTPDSAGRSTTSLNQSTIGNTATLNLKIIGMDSKSGNDFGTAYNYPLVLINNHSFRSGVAGV